MLAVEETGDPCGPAVLYFHGWPACRLEAGLIPDLPVRLLAFDRPGYGHSSPQPGRALLDWPQDVTAAADQLGLEKFHVVGLSGGGPYAAACAYALPDRVRGLALVSPVPPSSGAPRGIPGVGDLFRLGRHPRAARVLLSFLRSLLHARLVTPDILVGGNMPAADRAVLTPDILAALGQAWREGFRTGIAGALSDAQIYARHWGFTPEAIRVPTSLWTGTADTLTPVVALVPYAAIPGIRWHALPDQGHYSLAMTHARAIVAELVA